MESLKSRKHTADRRVMFPATNKCKCPTMRSGCRWWSHISCFAVPTFSISCDYQATAANSGTREIRVEVVPGGRNGAKSALVVCDNGKGMDAKGLQDYATYFLTQVR